MLFAKNNFSMFTGNDQKSLRYFINLMFQYSMLKLLDITENEFDKKHKKSY